MQHQSTLKCREFDFINWLGENSAIDKTAVRRLSAASQGTSAPLCSVILELGILDEEVLADRLADFLGLDRIAADNLNEEQIRDVPDMLPSFFTEAGLLPIGNLPNQLQIVTADPIASDKASAAAYFSGLDLVLLVSSLSALQKRIAEFKGGSQVDVSNASVDALEVVDGDAEKLRDLASEAPIIRLLNRLVAAAIEQNASDIHIEPIDQKLQIRFRVDGVMRIVETLAPSIHLALVSRIKILARLNIAEQRLPQDGRIRLAARGRNIDFRVATSPTVNGETVVMRVLDRKDIKLEFQSLGFSTSDVQRLQKILKHRNGIVLVTGPTGSGKTTTLYAALSLLNQPEIKIFTIEDPVEYQLVGISQIPVREAIGLDFATILRSVLRQDPDIVMIGEIRDGETARVAVQASMTGHLVLSTAHTNSAVAALTRLRDLGVEHYLLASSVRAVIAQRLVRRICSECRGQLAARSCQACGGTGYNGRTTVYELLEVDNTLQQAIADGKNDLDLSNAALAAGFQTLLQHGQQLVADGITSQDEINRVVSVQEQ